MNIPDIATHDEARNNREPAPGLADLLDLTEDLAEARWLLDRLTDALSDADRQAADLARLMTRIGQGVAVLRRSS